MNRQELAALIVEKLDQQKLQCSREFETPDQVAGFVVDDLLPDEIAQEVARAFPRSDQMVLRNSMHECKYVSSQISDYDPLIEECIFAFQEPEVVSKVSEITGIPNLLGDELLYAAGLSAMPKRCFLKPHLDNSHDLSGKRYRVLNLLYYVTPDWQESYGGNLEIWDHGVKAAPRTIVSRFNRLLVMSTFRTSWHSVSEVRHDDMRRCVSNYYFSKESLEQRDYYHVTSFKGRPKDGMLRAILAADRMARNVVGKTIRFFTKGNIKTTHVYKKDKK